MRTEVERMEVLIGVDPHKATNSVAAIDESGELLEHASFPSSRHGLRALGAWAKRFEKRRWAVERASGLGRAVAQYLVANGEGVVDVPAKLSARVRLLSTGGARKNDRLDAVYTAVAASQSERLRSVAEEDLVAVLRMLTERRDDLVKARTRAMNHLHALLRDLLPGGVAKRVPTARAAEILRRVRPRAGAGRARKRLAQDLLRDLRRLDRQIGELDGRIAEAVEESATSLTEIYGLGPILAAKIVGRVGDARRFPNKSHFASHTGTAPVEASSGEVVRHRLSRAGDRQLNYALHMIAICQIAQDTRGRAYYRRKIAEGKSGKEALRCLKRRISDAVFQKLRSDLRAASTAAA
jgi:transposase